MRQMVAGSPIGKNLIVAKVEKEKKNANEKYHTSVDSVSCMLRNIVCPPHRINVRLCQSLLSKSPHIHAHNYETIK